MKKLSIALGLILMSVSIYADSEITTGINSTTQYVQGIGLAICGLGGVVGGIMLAFNKESGSSWIANALIAAASIGGVVFAVKTIGEFFHAG